MAEQPSGTVEVASPLGTLAVELLRRLIRIDTVNPPGNEDAAQRLLGELLGDAGFACELLGAEPERPNLIARLPGTGEGPTLTLLGHVDTVRADPGEWRRDPWSGDLVDGEVWGRGALDMKGQVAAEVAACLDLAREGWRPRRGELMLVLCADEETGGSLGARWLCEEHPEKVRSDYVVNEGGGGAVERDGRRLYTFCIGEKGVFRFALRARGRAGHASLPAIGDNALLKLAPALERLRAQPPLEPTPSGLAFLSALLEEEVSAAGMEGALERVRAEEPHLARFLAEPMLGVTVTPTVARASDKVNVIPSVAEVIVDCRAPSGWGEDRVREQLEGLLEGTECEIELSEPVVGNSSPPDGELAQAIADWVAEADPGAGLLPIVMPGFSDSHWFRRAFDAATVYGFCPHREMGLLDAVPLFHGADERVPAADVELAATFFRHLPLRLLG